MKETLLLAHIHGDFLADNAEYLVIAVSHTTERQIERNQSRGHRVVAIGLQEALLHVVVVVRHHHNPGRREPAHEDGQEGNWRAHRPNGHDDQNDFAGGHALAVVVGIANRHVPVPGHGAEVLEGRGAAHDVPRHPEEAERATLAPLSGNVLDEGEWHDQYLNCALYI